MDLSLPHDVPSALNFTEKLVIHLCSPLFGLNYHLTTDNYFTSLRLAEILLKNGMTLTGTWRTNRGVSKILKDKRQNANSSTFMRRNKVLAVKWTEKKSSTKKDVYLLDSRRSCSTEKATLRKRGGRHEDVFKPTTILAYNKTMGGVDRSDSMCERYDPTRKSTNWMVKYGIHLIHRLIMNAHVVYQEHGGKHPLLDFTLLYIKQTLRSTGQGRKSAAAGRPRQVSVGHQPVLLPPTNNKSNPTRRCRLCFQKKTRKETRYFCKECPEMPSLCVTCFSDFHQK